MRLLFQAEEKTKEAAADDVDEMPATTEKNDGNDNDDGSSTSAPAAPHAPDTLLEYVLTHYRGLLCLFFLLPLSVAFELFLYLRNTVNFLLRARAPKKHAAKVRAICDQVRAWGRDQEEATGEKQKKERMCSARPGWQTMSLRVGLYKKTYRNIQLVALTEVLEVDVAGKLVRVEPMCTMGQLTHALLPLGWTLPVLPELDDL